MYLSFARELVVCFVLAGRKISQRKQR